MDSLTIHGEYTNLPIKIHLTDGHIMFCVIIGFDPTPISKMERWKIVENNDLKDFSLTRDEKYIHFVNHEDIENITWQLL